MRSSLHSKFLEKAQAAITSAVEAYNKPSFAYREETFALLALNAWELLLKAKVLKDGDNDLKVIRVYGLAAISPKRFLWYCLCRL